MKIIVPIKQILDPSGITVRRDKERIFVNREDYMVDPGSKAAIEAALQLRASDDEVVALSMGRPQADDALREALAMGCDAAYLLSDESFEEADVTVTTLILAAAINKLDGADLVITGRQSADTGAGQIGPRLAEALGYAQVTDVYVLAAAAGGKVRATRRWAAGYAAVEASLPAVVTVAPEAFPPRYAHGARIMNAYRQWQVTTWDAADLALDDAALEPRLAFRSQSFPPPLEIGEQFRGAATDVAQEVILALKLQKLVG
ncbi:MAG: electron transfer flavoprotein subunit beta/FixA family protein [Anaerolineae bacterium]|jgi:electron transfer flavoprotein beta subunit